MTTHGYERPATRHARSFVAPVSAPERDEPEQVPEMCDALADLFIGSEPVAGGAPQAASNRSPQVYSSVHAPQDRQGQQVRDSQGRQPAASSHALRFPAEQSSASAPSVSSSMPTPVADATKASIRASSKHPPVRQTSRSGPTSAARTEHIPVELVLVGHLPVRSSAWIRGFIAEQQDQTHAQTHPAAMVRVFDGYTTSELIERAGSHIAHTQPNAPDDPTTVDGMIDTLRTRASRVYIRYGRGDQSPLAACDRVDAVNILTGADDAALVAAFRVLKSVAEHRIGASVPNALGAIRLVVCGAGPDACARAVERLRMAMARFAEASGEQAGPVVAGPSVLQPVLTDHVYEGELRIDPRDLVASLSTPAEHDSSRQDAGRPGDHVQAAPDIIHEVQSEVVSNDTLFREPRSERLQPTHDLHEKFMPNDAAAAMSATAGLAADDTDQGDWPQLEPIDADTNPTLPPQPLPLQPKSQEPVHQGQARHAPSNHDNAACPLPGLRALQARCPYAARIQLATDDTGGLHLIASASGTPAEAVESLTIARDWAAEHMDLLRLTPGAAALQTRITRHLLTAEPRLARRLLDGDLRVYATTPGTAEYSAGTPVIAIN